MTSNSSFPGDLQEPFRWIADVAVMEAFESGVLDLPDFYFTGDNYRFRFEQGYRWLCEGLVSLAFLFPC